MNEPKLNITAAFDAQVLEKYIDDKCEYLINIKMQAIIDRLEQERDTMTAEEVMDRLKIRRTCLYRLSIDGLLKPITKLGRQRIYRKYDVENLLKNKSTKYFTKQNYEKAISSIGH